MARSHADKRKTRGHLVSSPEKMRRLYKSLIEAANSDERLAMLAVANPIMAMEDMGYSFTDKYRSHLDRIIRFPAEAVKRLDSLEEQIHKMAGRHFIIDSEKELGRVLFEDLNLPRVRQTFKAQAHPSQLPSDLSDLPTAPLPPQVGWGKKLKDPLEELKGTHPIMGPLLAYRQLEASQPRLATQAVYKKIKRGEAKLPITRVKFHVRGARKSK